MTKKNIEKQVRRALRELTKTERRTVAGGPESDRDKGTGNN